MHYKKFIIRKYKAISEDLEVKLGENGAVPIIGINECGKTTILQAMLAFDYRNDDDDVRYKHLTNIINRYNYDEREEAIICAEISCTKEDLKDVFLRLNYKVPDDEDHEYTFEDVDNDIGSFNSSWTDAVDNFREAIPKNNTIEITRTIGNDKKPEYKFKIGEFKSFSENDLDINFYKSVIRRLPRMVYYDYHVDKISSPIGIPKENNKGYNDYSFQTFKRILESFGSNIMNIGKKQLRTIATNFNNELREEWDHLQKIEDVSSKSKLEIELSRENGEINIGIVETVEEKKTVNKKEIINKKSSDFDLDQRSRGFLWFFNLIIKTFSYRKNKNGVIYLLDEPGCYLHASSQVALGKILKELAKKNFVVYTTHYQHLLQKAFLSRTMTCHRDIKDDSNIKLTHSLEHKKGKDEAFQPIRDALGSVPSLLEEAFTKDKIVVVEGITDYYALSTVDSGEDFGIIPMTGTTSMESFISSFFCPKEKVYCLLDDDNAGNDSGDNISKDPECNVQVNHLKHGKKIEQIFDKDEVTYLIKNDPHFSNLQGCSKNIDIGVVNSFIIELASYPDIETLMSDPEGLAKSKENIIREIKIIFGETKNKPAAKEKLPPKTNIETYKKTDVSGANGSEQVDEV